MYVAYTGWAKKVIPLVQCNIMYERYHFFGPPCINKGLRLTMCYEFHVKLNCNKQEQKTKK